MVKLRLRDNEGINDAVKRFRKLVEHAGIKKEMRRREFYEKPTQERKRQRALLLRFEQARIFDGNHRLVGEGLDKRDLLVGERPDLPSAY